MPIFIGTVKIAIPATKQVRATIGFALPASATLGIYEVKVMVWNTWPTKPEWRALADPALINFYVIGSGG
jgi:hypothetical protein